jgi:GT2 family glycosyltransferase
MEKILNDVNHDPLTSIIILNYNGGNDLFECIESVVQTKDCKYEIILIDNGSSDDSHIKCKNEFPKIKLIQNKKNIGMTARNIGIDNSKADFVVFLDSDTVVEKFWLKHLIESFKKHGDGLYQPKILEKQNRDIISSCGNLINIFGFGFAKERGKKDNVQFDEFSKIGYTSGACTFSSLNTIKKIGKIDEIFFAYHDDLEYGWRASLLGIDSFFESHSRIYHRVSLTLEKSSSKKFFLTERNRLICLKTLYSKKTYYKIFPLILILEIGIFIYFLTKGLGLMKLKTYFSLLKLNSKISEKRKNIEKIRNYPDVQIIKKFSDEFILPHDVISTKNSNKINSIMIFLSNSARKLINT